MTCCLFSGSTYLSSISSSFVTVSELFCGEVFKTFVILLTVLFPIKSLIASSVFWIAPLGAVLNASEMFDQYFSGYIYHVSFYLYFDQYFYLYF